MEASREDRNAEFVRLGLEAYNRGDFDRVLELLDDDVEVFTAPGLINSGTYRGHDGYRHWIEHWEEAWDDFQIEIEGIELLGDRHVIVDVHQSATGVGSGLEVDMRLAQLYEIDESGRATRFHLYPDLEAARAAAERFARDPDAAA